MSNASEVITPSYRFKDTLEREQEDLDSEMTPLTSNGEKNQAALEEQKTFTDYCVMTE